MTYEEFKQNFLPEFLNIRSFAGRIKYASQYLQQIGSGSGRIVYDIDGEKVLKLAKNAKGIAQNKAEAGAGYYRDTQHIVTKVFDNADDDSWLISEKGKKVTDKRIRELTGIPSLEKLHDFLKIVENNQKPGRNMFSHLLSKEEKEFFWENEFSSNLADFVINYGQTTGDMGRPSSYGEVVRDGQPIIVLTDYGLNDEVYNTYYNPQRKEKYRMYELFDYADGNDDILSDAGEGDEIRTGMWALIPYDVDSGSGVFNEEFIGFVLNRNKYPDKSISNLPTLTDNFHECVNNIKETLNRVENKGVFYNNLLELQNYLIRRGFFERDSLLKEENPRVQPYTLDNKERALDLAKAFTEKMGLGNPQLIGGGANGYAFALNNNVVLKLTADVSEADAGLIIMHHKPKTIAAVYNVYKIVDTEKNQSFFAILQENIVNKPIEKFRRFEQVVEAILPDGMMLHDFYKNMKTHRFNYENLLASAKHILTDNPEANISDAERQETYNYLVGLINIRKDLIDLGIKSMDYVEIGNLGYKDGMLKFFDTGGYSAEEPEVGDFNTIYLPENRENLTEHYDVNTANKIASQVATIMNLGSPRLLGSGYFGVAYDIGNDRVLKITKDKSEAVENLMLIGKPLKYIAQPYGVYSIKSKSDAKIPETYAIVLEKLKTDPNIQKAYDRLEFAFNKIMGVKVSDVIEFYLGEWDDGRVKKNKIDSYFKKNPQDAEFFGDLVRIAEEAKALGVESMDYLNSNNLGYKKNGALGFFDVGWGNFLLEPRGAETIEVDGDGSSKFSTGDSVGQDDFPAYNQNDNSPITDNNIPVNLQEREKSFMRGSNQVNVKKNVDLGV